MQLEGKDHEHGITESLDDGARNARRTVMRALRFMVPKTSPRGAILAHPECMGCACIECVHDHPSMCTERYCA